MSNQFSGRNLLSAESGQRVVKINEFEVDEISTKTHLPIFEFPRLLYRCPISSENFNTYHAMGKFSRWQTDDGFLIFLRKWDLILLKRQFAWNVKSYFLGKIRNIFWNAICWIFYPTYKELKQFYYYYSILLCLNSFHSRMMKPHLLQNTMHQKSMSAQNTTHQVEIYM